MSALPENGLGQHPIKRTGLIYAWHYTSLDREHVEDFVSQDPTLRMYAPDRALSGHYPPSLNRRGQIAGGCRYFRRGDGAGDLNAHGNSAMILGGDNAPSAPGVPSALLNAVRGDFTYCAWIKPSWHREANFNTGYVNGLFGAQGDGNANTNYLWSFIIRHNGADSIGMIAQTFWEYATGTNLTTSFVGFTFENDRWYYVAIRKRGAVAADGSFVTTPTVYQDLFVNGELVDTQGPLRNCEGGNAVDQGWLDNAQSAGSWLLATPAEVQKAGVYLYDRPLLAEEIREDYRRGLPADVETAIASSVRVDTADDQTMGVDLHDVEGVDLVQSISVSDDVETGTKTGSLELRREQIELSLAYLRTESKLNLADPSLGIGSVGNWVPMLSLNREIDIRAGVSPAFLNPVGQDFVSLLRGRIDRVDWGGQSTVTLDARDLGGILLDTYMEEEREYGGTVVPPDASNVEDILQQILDDNSADLGPLSPTGSYTSPTLRYWRLPPWFILPYAQRREGVLTALRSLAQQIGWDVRYRFFHSEELEDWKLSFYEVQRDAPPGALVIPNRSILDVQAAELDVQRVRNVIRVGFPSSEATLATPPAAPAGWSQLAYESAGPDGRGGRTYGFITLENPTSIAAFGRRFMEVIESSSSQIDTYTEAQALAYACGSDLGEPEFSHSLRTVFMPHATPQSMARIDPVRELFTGGQRLAVQNISHELGASASSTVAMRGSPTVGYKRWLTLDARRGGPPIIRPTEGLTDLTQGRILQAIKSFLDTTDYFAGGKAVQTRNSDFALLSSGEAYPPDAWRVLQGTWGTDAETELTDVQTGGRAVRLRNGDTLLISDLIPVQATQPYLAEVNQLRTDGADSPLRVAISTFEEDRTTPAGNTTLLVPINSAGNVFEASRQHYTMSASARWAYIAALTPPSPAGEFVVDRLALYRVSHQARMQYTLNQSLALNVWNILAWNDSSSAQTDGDGPHDWGGITDLVGNRFSIREAGVYEIQVDFEASSTALAAGTPFCGVRIGRNGTGGGAAGTPEVENVSPLTQQLSGGRYRSRASASCVRYLAPGDTIEAYYYLSAGSTPQNQANRSRFVIKQRFAD